MRALLEAERQRIHDEIRSYPTPIPRCDQQFNRLIEEREQLSRELAQLDAVGPPAALAKDGSAALDAFIDASSCLDAEAKRQLKAALRNSPVEQSGPKRAAQQPTAPITLLAANKPQVD